MSTQNQTVTLQDAVALQVKEFAANSQKFSVHDVTVAVRGKVNAGTLEIPEVEVQGSSFRFDIPHVKVKSLFEDLWRNGTFDADFTLNRAFNGTFYEYTPSLSQLSGAAPTPTAQMSIAQPQINPPSASVGSSVKERIQKYLENCANRNFQPTLKQVQSAIKRGNQSTGVSCEDLNTIITNDLGYSVTADPNYVSASQVVI